VPRYLVEPTYLASLGQVSEIIDTQTRRRILVAGTGHADRAKVRVAALNAAAEAPAAAPAATGCGCPSSPRP